MTEKFGISEKGELTILEHWLKDVYNNILKIPQGLGNPLRTFGSEAYHTLFI